MLRLAPPPEATREWWPEIARRCRCPQQGDIPRIGDVLALGIEPGVPAVRIVAFFKYHDNGKPAKGMYQTLVRCYRPGDTWFPTGEYKYGALGIAWTPWLGVEKWLAKQ